MIDRISKAKPEKRREKKKLNDLEPKRKKKLTCREDKRKGRPKQSRGKSEVKKGQVKKVKTVKKGQASDNYSCLICGELYTNSRPGERWIQCERCSGWCHEDCTDGETARGFFCDFCCENK